ncbi:MAG: hypothetical protein VX589_14425 [Myxococcota bacterium]|nr:hypothetical protein [Myxococcota bacterium]
MRRIKRGWLVAILGVLGCGADIGGEHPSGYGAQTINDTQDAGTATSELNSEVSEAVWARRLVFTGIAETPVGQQLTHIIAIARIRIVRTEDGLVAVEDTCQTEVIRPDFPDVITELPTAFIDSMPITRRGFRQEGNQVAFAETVELQGVRLTDPYVEELPTQVDDHRVFDQDDDGQPGVTVRLTGFLQGTLYLIQRIISRLSGTATERRMEGFARWSSEEVVLAANPELLKVPTNITPIDDVTQNYFIAVRIDAQLDCRDILTQASSLFQGASP